MILWKSIVYISNRYHFKAQSLAVKLFIPWTWEVRRACEKF